MVALAFLGRAASAAHAPGSDVGEHGQHKRDEKQDADAEWLRAKGFLESIEAVSLRRTVVEGLEIVEDTRVANTIAAKVLLNIAGKVLEALRELDDLSLVVRISSDLCSFESLHSLIAVPEVIVASCGRC